MFPFFRHEGPMFKDIEEIVEYFYNNKCKNDYLLITSTFGGPWWLSMVHENGTRISKIVTIDDWSQVGNWQKRLGKQLDKQDQVE